MSLALAACVFGIVVLCFMLFRSRGRKTPEVSRDTTPAIESWIAEALEAELAEGALGLRSSTPEERQKLAQSLRGEPDPAVVSAVEEKVRAVELEFVRYAHEPDAQLTLRVRYEDGNAGTATKRIPWSDVPAAVAHDFDKRGSTRVFRTWAFPWSRAEAL